VEQLHARPSSRSVWDGLRGGGGRHYADFLRFFQDEIARDGWQAVVVRALLDEGDELADDLLQRLFGGVLHPLIQLMYGVEWAQPAIVAQALAQAAVHDNSIGPFLADAEKLSREGRASGGEEEWTVGGLYAAAGTDARLWQSYRRDDENRLTTGVLARARDEALALAARVRIPADEAVVAERTAEMVDGVAAMAASGAVHEAAARGKQPRFDFFVMCV
jgi:hypothetical protein